MSKSFMPPTPKSVRADIYRQAARLMESAAQYTAYPCWCIARVEGHSDVGEWRDAPSVLPFLSTFSAKAGINSMSDDFMNRMYDELDGHLSRSGCIVALCFMAAMVEAGDA